MEQTRAKMLGALVAAGPTGLVARELTSPIERMVDGKRDFVRGSEKLRVSRQDYRALHGLVDTGYATLVEEKNINLAPGKATRVIERFSVTILGVQEHWSMT
jgi:hypothetical protein